VLSRIRTFIIITFFAALIWLFAEAASLGEANVPDVTVRLTSANTQQRLVRPSSDWRSRVSVELRGSRISIEEARATLSAGIELSPGMLGVPDGGGTVDLLTALRSVSGIADTGVEVIAVTPIRDRKSVV